ncbi:hypothetical protein LBMAG52_05320 [Planctomycetia bacterium]|nr:hypothetical protein LBMAG52_05320 [Planctomycetia bacterium]
MSVVIGGTGVDWTGEESGLVPTGVDGGFPNADPTKGFCGVAENVGADVPDGGGEDEATVSGVRNGSDADAG